MNPREPTRSARIEKSRPRANTSNSRPQIQRVLTGQHIDDSSVYNAGDLDAEQHSEADDSDNSETEKGRADSGFSEEVNQAFRLRQWKEQDLEAPLEKKVTTRSAKDPNLVALFSCRLSIQVTLADSDRSHGMAQMTQKTPKTGHWEGNGQPLLSFLHSP